MTRPEGYLPAAGLRWLVSINFQDLLERIPWQKHLEPLVTEEGIRDFELSTGLSRERVLRVVIAGFDFSTLYLVQTQGDNSRAELAFIERLRHEPLRSHPHPRVTSIAGVIGATPQRMVRLHDHLVAIAVGDPTPARAVEAFARGKLKRSPSVYEGAAWSALPEGLERADILFFAPGPFGGEWAKGAAGLLEPSLAVAITARFTRKLSAVAHMDTDAPTPANPFGEHPGGLNAPSAATGASLPPPAMLDISVFLAGDFARERDVQARLQGVWGAVSESSFGRLFGLHEPVESARVREDSSSLRLAVKLQFDPLLFGLYSAVKAEVRDFLGPLEKGERKH